MAPWLEHILIAGCERLVGLRANTPTPEQLARTVIVAHRGERDGKQIIENTLAAFDPVVAAGVGAIEFDIRYTRDDEPVVHHDATLARTFGIDAAIADLSWAELQQEAPAVAHLNTMIARYARRAVLMIELKERGTPVAERRLHAALRDLVPVRDYRFLSLVPDLFDAVADTPAAARIIVAKTNWRDIRTWSKQHPCGGIAGPFLFIRQADIDALTDDNEFIGSGFLTQRSALMHEIARGVPWIFTNKPIALQGMLDAALSNATEENRQRMNANKRE